MKIVIMPSVNGPNGKLAEAEIHFTNAGVLTDIKIVGFSIWKRDGEQLRVSMPARQYEKNGKKEYWDFVRGLTGLDDLDKLKDAIINEYKKSISSF